MADGKSLSQLPHELMVRVLSFLDLPSISNAACVCKNWYGITKDEFLWRKVVKRSLPPGSEVKKHPSISWFHMAQAVKRNQPIHRIGCMECGAFPIIGARFECWHCEKYVICSVCEETTSHPKNHILMMMRYPRMIRNRLYSHAPLPACTACGSVVPRTTPVTNPSSPLGETAVDTAASVTPSSPPVQKISVCVTCPHAIEEDLPVPTVYLCNVCLPSHPPRHKTFQLRFAPEPLVPRSVRGKNPRGAWCNVCSARCNGINWKCTSCFGYDLCEPCCQKNAHVKKHALLKMFNACEHNWKFSGRIAIYHDDKDKHKDKESDTEEVDVCHREDVYNKKVYTISSFQYLSDDPQPAEDDYAHGPSSEEEEEEEDEAQPQNPFAEIVDLMRRYPEMFAQIREKPETAPNISALAIYDIFQALHGGGGNEHGDEEEEEEEEESAYPTEPVQYQLLESDDSDGYEDEELPDTK